MIFDKNFLPPTAPPRLGNIGNIGNEKSRLLYSIFFGAFRIRFNLRKSSAVIEADKPGLGNPVNFDERGSRPARQIKSEVICTRPAAPPDNTAADDDERVKAAVLRITAKTPL